MTMTVTVALFVLAALAVVNLLVSLAVVRSGYYTQIQIVWQVLLIWLAPVIGPVLIGAFLRSQRGNPMFDTCAFPDTNEKGVALEQKSKATRVALACGSIR